MLEFFSIRFHIPIPDDSRMVTDENILHIYEKRLKESYCDKVTSSIPYKLIIENELIRIKPDLNFNIWYGINYGEVIIHKNQNDKRFIQYKLNYTKAFFYL